MGSGMGPDGGSRAAAGTDVFARLDSIYSTALAQQNWGPASQTRAMAATMAQQQGRMDLFLRYFEEAIQIAAEHKLVRLEMSNRITLLRGLVNSDLSGQTLDRLNRELKGIFSATGEVVAAGAFVEQLEIYSAAALAAYDSVLAAVDESTSGLKDALTRAQDSAAAFSLTLPEGQLGDVRDQVNNQQTPSVDLRTRIKTAVASARSETVKICDSLRVDVHLLAAQAADKQKHFRIRNGLLDRAELLVRSGSESQVSVYLARADYATGSRAIEYARRAVKACEQVHFAALKNQAAAKLDQLLAEADADYEPETTAAGGGATATVLGLVGRAQQALQEKRFENSLKLASDAMTAANVPHLRRAALRQRALALYELGRFQEAEAETDECIALMQAELTAQATPADSEYFDSRLAEDENLHLMKAFLRAKAGRSTEAWECAEEGRAGRLKREIGEGEEFSASFASLRDWLRTQRAAIVSFGPTRWGTLVMSAGPHDLDPQAQFLDFSYRDVAQALGSERGSEDAKILASVDGLSAGLIHPLGERLQAIAGDADVLYIVPDSALFCAPFGALTLDCSDQNDCSAQSRMLVDLCPLAVTPSAVLLQWCASRQAPYIRNCLAVSAGESQGIQFCDDLPRLAAAPWTVAPVELVGENANPQEIASLASLYSVFYLACHGAMRDGIQDVMAASQLQLSGGSSLSASDVLGWKLHADLVFLNACLAGRFRQGARSDVNGFVKAFMLAGANSIIAPVVSVDTRLALDMAESFFQHWLGGATKAAALQAAQLAARAKYQDRQWATYLLFWHFI